ASNMVLSATARAGYVLGDRNPKGNNVTVGAEGNIGFDVGQHILGEDQKTSLLYHWDNGGVFASAHEHAGPVEFTGTISVLYNAGSDYRLQVPVSIRLAYNANGQLGFQVNASAMPAHWTFQTVPAHDYAPREDFFYNASIGPFIKVGPVTFSVASGVNG